MPENKKQFRPSLVAYISMCLFLCVSFVILVGNCVHKRNIQNKIDSLDESVCCFIGVGNSMSPTINTGDISVATTKFSVTDLTHGTLIAFSYDTVIEYDSSYDFEEHPNVVTKRIIGLPGDVLYYDSTTSTLYINNQVYTEPYLADKEYEWELGEYTVPDNCVFVMGDNRNISVDSRDFGSIPMQKITHIIIDVISKSDLEIYLSS